MLQSLTIKIDQYEYQLLQGYADYWFKWCYAHFYVRKSRGIPPETIVAQMMGKYFSKRADMVKFPRLGKTLSIEYYEAQAFMEVTTVCDDLPTIQMRGKIDLELTNWKPSLSKPNMKQWYEAEEAMKDTFGEFEELDDMRFDVVNQIYNQHELLKDEHNG